MQLKSLLLFLLASLLSAVSAAQAAGELNKTVQMEIPAQALSPALILFSGQTNIQVITRAGDVSRHKTRGVSGRMSVEAALKKLLEGTGFSYMVVGDGTVEISTRAPAGRPAQPVADVAGGAQLRLAQAAGPDEGKRATTQSAVEEEGLRGVPEILVKGNRSMNTDIERTEDAPQPYVVFGGEEIRRSQASNLEEFLRTRLPMNTASRAAGQDLGSSSMISSVNLRGLGSGQTLILVDGRRMPGVSNNGNLQQPDINGIPVSAIERIEVLPSTAGGIYGGSATGGVINIVLRRDYSGMEARLNYANTFDTDASALRVELNGGFSLEEGRTQVTVTASHSQANTLTAGDRDFNERGVALQLRNDPQGYYDSFSGGIPVGYTANIRSTSGPLTLKSQYGGASLGSNITHIPVGYAGPASDSGAGLRANAGSWNLNLPGAGYGREGSLVAAPELKSVMANIRREFGSRVEAFVDLSSLDSKGSATIGFMPSFATLAPTAPNNPFNETIQVSFPSPGWTSSDLTTQSTTLRALGGVIFRLPGNWMAEMDYGWNRSRNRSAGLSASVQNINAILNSGLASPDGRPAINVLQEGNTYPLDYSAYLLPQPNVFRGPYDTILKNLTLRGSGPLLQLPAGALTLSASVERRDEAMEDALVTQIIPNTGGWFHSWYPGRSLDVDSGYVELNAPLVAQAQSIPFVSQLQLQASVRRDRYTMKTNPAGSITVPSADGPFPAVQYTDTGFSSDDYTLALRYKLIEDVTLRASFGTGFMPPSMSQLAPPTPGRLGGDLAFDIRRNDSALVYPLDIQSGGNPGLQPESSRSFSAGMILTPRVLPGLRVSMDYTRIRKSDEIVAPSTQFLIDYESVFPDRIRRADPGINDPAGWPGIITWVDRSNLNIARSDVQAYDVQADYTFTTPASGDFHVYTLFTWQPHYKTQGLPTAAFVDSTGFSNGPLEWRGNAGLTWDQGPLTVGWNVQYYDAYRVTLSTDSPAIRAIRIRWQGEEGIPGQLYHDLIASYRFDRSWLANTEVSVGIQNVFDRDPPILAISHPAIPAYSYYGDPRLRRYSVSIRKSFN